MLNCVEHEKSFIISGPYFEGETSYDTVSCFEDILQTKELVLAKEGGLSIKVLSPKRWTILGSVFAVQQLQDSSGVRVCER